MKRIITFFLINCVTIILFAHSQTYSSHLTRPDSVVILNHDLDTMFAYSITKEMFCQNNHNYSSFTSHNDINHVLALLEKLQMIGIDSVDSKHTIKEAIVTSKLRNRIMWIERGYDIRALILIYYPEDVEINWVTQFHVQRGNKKYKMSEELYSFLQSLL